MRETQITVPELVMIAGTRVALGAGVGLLLADRLSDDRRKAVGWTLVTFGLLSTIPLAFEVFGRRGSGESAEGPEPGSSEPWYASSQHFSNRGRSAPS